MDKASVIYFREKYKGWPLVYICDNEHNFMENASDAIPPVWDDANERVMYIQNNQDGGRMNPKLPLTITITNYEHIQLIKALVDKKEAAKFMADNKASMSSDEFKYGMTLIGGSAAAHRPTGAANLYWDDGKIKDTNEPH